MAEAITPHSEIIAGSDLTGSSGATDRTYTLSNSGAVDGAIDIIVQGRSLMQGASRDYTFNDSTDTITFKTAIKDAWLIEIKYFTNITVASTAISVQKVRDLSGITSTDDIADAVITRIIGEATLGIENDLGVSQSVTEIIEIISGDRILQPRNKRLHGNNGVYSNYHFDGGWRTIRVKNRPLLSVREVRNDDTTLDVSNLKFDVERGLIRLGPDAADSFFDADEAYKVRVRYLHGKKRFSSDTRTKLNGAVTEGTSVDLTVDDSSDFSANDYIFIQGMDGNQEAAKIKSVPDGTSITVDELAYDHEDDSLVMLLENDTNLSQLILWESVIRTLLHDAGANVTNIGSVSLGDYSESTSTEANKERLEYARNERNRLLDKFRKIEVL